MPMFAMAMPLPPGKTEAWKKFIGELNGARRAQFVESRKRLGVRERTFLQHSPHGDMIIVTLEGENPSQAFAQFGQGSDEFTSWFKKQVSEIHGVDLAAPPPGPMPEMVIDSQA
jgi:hypothetical protein